MSPRLVTIVIVNHNYDRFLRAAIESALSQSYPYVEVVVVDDGSTDRSRDVIAAYATRIVPVLKENGGQTDAMNIGFAASSGDIVCFLDADDLLHPEAMETAAALFEDPRVVKVHGPLEEIDHRGEPTGRLWPAEPLPEGDLMPQLVQHGPASFPFVSQSGNVFARSLLEHVVPLPLLERDLGCGSASADFYLSMLAAAEGHVRRADRPLGCYRVHGANDFATDSIDRKLARTIGSADRHFSELADRLRTRGLVADVAEWRRRSWFHRTARLIDEIGTVVPEGHPLILVDDEITGLSGTRRWRVIPFRERGGVYWGPPADGAEAVAELERHRRDGAEAIVFAWCSRWWLDSYPDLAKHLVEHHPRVLATDLALAFDLTHRLSGEADLSREEVRLRGAVLSNGA